MLNKMMFVIMGVVLLGCTNVEKSSNVNCDGDWKQIGLETAQAGKSVRTLDEYIAVCGKKAESGKSAYLDGYAREIINYCSRDNGFSIGFKNLKMPEVCPYELRPEFVKGYELGQNEYQSKIGQFEDLVKQYERDKDNNIFNDALTKENARLSQPK